MRSKPSDASKRVLVVTYAYLPSETSSALQTVSLVRMLPKAGWKPVVLTVAPAWQYLPTNTDSPGSADVEVIRVGHWRPLAALESAIRIGNSPKVNGPKQEMTRGNRPPARPGLGWAWIGAHYYQGLSTSLRGAMRSLYQNLRPTDWDFLFPSFAVSRGYRVAGRRQLSAVYSIGKPFSSLVAGQILAKILRLPHVVELHDPWTLSPSYSGKGLIARFEKNLERWVVANARAAIAKTPAETELLRKVRPGARTSFYTVPCGFDETRMPEPAKVSPPRSAVDGSVRIVHCGSLSERRSPIPFLLALGQLLGENPMLRNGLKVLFAGRSDTFEGRSLSDWCSGLGLAGTVEIKGWLRREDLLDLMSDADIFVVFPDNWHQIPAKIYEYLWFGRRILVVCEKGSESAKLVQKFNRGVFALRSDPGSITRALRSLVEQCQAEPHHKAGDEALFPYSARGRAEAVAAILDSIYS
jgi:glycosyltransferase involved in cell wall biosynthesis